MAILYGVVARQNVVLARHAGQAGNFAEIADLLLSKLKCEDVNEKMSYESGAYFYHYKQGQHGLVYLCFADKAFRRTLAFAFLDSIQDKFEKQFANTSTAIPFAANAEFAPVIAAEMKRFNTEKENMSMEELADRQPGAPGGSHENPDKVERVREEVERVKDIMVANIDSLMERGERLDLLVDKTENLSAHSVNFKQTSRTLRRRMWWQNKKMTLIVGVAVLIGIYVIVSISCGGVAWPNCV